MNIQSGRPLDWANKNHASRSDQERKTYEHPTTKLPKSKVIIEVLGGVASVKECPDDVEVEIIDWDNINESEEINNGK